MKLYAKNNILHTVTAMKRSGRFAHSFLLTGEKGSGRTSAAKYIAMALLCNSSDADGLPCGVCRNCRRIEEGTHPDVIIPEGGGKTGSYTAASIRALIADAYILPNDGEEKVYIIRDAEKLRAVCQNILLKIIEEPPDHVYFILTASDKSELLPTVLSRMTVLGIPECSRSECHKALADMGSFSDEDTELAVSAYGGNIGKCTDFLNGGDSRSMYDLVIRIADGMIASDKYTVLKELSSCTDRNKFRCVLEMLDRILRDSLVINMVDSDKLTGCSEKAAAALSSRTGTEKTLAVHDKLIEAENSCSASMNLNLSAAACIVTEFLCKI